MLGWVKRSVLWSVEVLSVVPWLKSASIAATTVAVPEVGALKSSLPVFNHLFKVLV
jgi:hypothetical protein